MPGPARISLTLNRLVPHGDPDDDAYSVHDDTNSCVPDTVELDATVLGVR